MTTGSSMARSTSGTSKQFLGNVDAIRTITTFVGVLFGVAGFEHGLFEALQGNRPTNGLIIQAIGPEQRFWPLGTEEAFTLVPNFLITGILAMTVGAAIIVWSIAFIRTRRGPLVFLLLFVVLFLVGGGIGQLVFFLPAWAFATRMHTSLAWWRRILPRSLLPTLAWLWVVFLGLATVAMLVGLQAAVFGWIPGLEEPTQIRDTSMLLVFSSAILYVFAYIAGLGHRLHTESLEAEAATRQTQ
jgi:hypothetical protein